MQWHWGNIGSMLAGLSTIVIAVGALIRGPAVIRSWLDRQAADAEEPRARAATLSEDAGERRLERRRTLLGWSPNGVETYSVALVTDPAEMDQAKAELAGGGPTGYVVLRVDEGEYTSPNRGQVVGVARGHGHGRDRLRGPGLLGAGRQRVRGRRYRLAGDVPGDRPAAVAGVREVGLRHQGQSTGRAR
jgi:hypothetical protein